MARDAAIAEAMEAEEGDPAEPALCSRPLRLGERQLDSEKGQQQRRTQVIMCRRPMVSESAAAMGAQKMSATAMKARHRP